MAVRISASVRMLFTEAPLLHRFARAQALGFDGVEIQNLTEAPVADLAGAAAAAGIPIVLINLDVGDALSGGPGLVGVPGRKDAFRRAFEEGMAAAEILKPTYVHFGPSRVPADVAREACEAVWLDNVAWAMGQASGSPHIFLAEGMNRRDAPDILLADHAAAARLARQVPGVRLILDLFHVAQNGGDAVSDYGRDADLIVHVQFAKAPDRGPPQPGDPAFWELARSLTGLGYEGWWGAEYSADGDTARSLGWMQGLRAVA